MFEAIANFSDLGGLPGAGGRSIRPGVLFRSGHLANSTDGDLAQLQALQIRLICDLRSAKERQRLPNRAPSGAPIETLALEVNQNAGLVPGTMPTAATMRDSMLTVYRSQPRALHGKLASLVERLVDGHALPVLVHCNSGKDCTGFVCAMLLYALGTPTAHIFEDYLSHGLDTAFFGADRRPALRELFGADPSDEVLAPLAAAETQYLQAAFDSAAQEYGSLDAYLEQAAGLSPQRRAALQQIILVK